MNGAGTVFLETGRPDRENTRTLRFANPTAVIEAYSVEDVVPALAAADSWIGRGYWIAGYLEYEAGFAFEKIAPLPQFDSPLVWLGVYERPLEDSLSPLTASRGWDDANDSHLQPAFTISRGPYRKSIETVKRHLFEGDVYQINLTGEFEFDFGGAPEYLYRMLRSRQPVAYNACIVTEHGAVVSCSPELFFRRSGSRIRTRPMKGTVRRGRNTSEDEVLSRWLETSAKNRAENLMIVDLLRNDLSRISEFGTVDTTRLFEPEIYETVIQLTSTVEATLRPDTTYSQIFAALFPCGSVTGAPKVRAMKIIHHIEQRRRGVYTGAIGYASPDGDAVFSVAIRTAILHNGVGRMGSGGGIVWDSEADAEYREALLKGNFLSGAEARPDLIETMVWDGGFVRLERHLARLRRSAAELGYPVQEQAIRGALDELSRDFKRRMRVRLLVHPDGEHSVSGSPLEGPSVEPGPVTIATVRMDRNDPWLRHKTTRRDVYEAEYQAARRRGFVEAIFLNDEGEVTEGSRTNLFIRRDGLLLTPPLESGVLPGTRRAEILETDSSASEAVLHLEDLESADEILVCNGTTPLTPVTLATRSLTPADSVG